VSTRKQVYLFISGVYGGNKDCCLAQQMSTIALSLPRQPNQWIISKRGDLTWFIGAAFIGYTLLALAAIYGSLPIRLIVLWAFAIDGPHVFSTGTRVLFDPVERKRVGRLWLALIPLCLVGPAVTFFLSPNLFYMLIATWSHYHISKQHMGFMFIYKRKAGERSDFKLDKYFVLTLLILPYVFYITTLLTGRSDSLVLFLAAGIAFAVYYCWRQIRMPKRNWPKLLLLAACIPLTWAAFVYAAMDTASAGRFVTAVIALNVLHSAQYLRLMFFHNKNRYAESNGLLGKISRKWIYFFAAAIVLSFPWRVAENYNSLVGLFAVGITFFHFIVDGKIWRVRGDAELARALRL
jgi:hypothetical protein